MNKLYIDMQGILLESSKHFHFFDFKEFIRDVRKAYGVTEFYLVGNYKNRVTNLIANDLQTHELSQKGVQIESFNELDNRAYDEAALLTALSKDFFCQEKLDDNEYYIATTNAAPLDMLYFMANNDGKMHLILPSSKDYEARDNVALAFDVASEVSLNFDRNLGDRLCIKEIHDMLEWSNNRGVLAKRIDVVSRLKKFSKISEGMTTFFLNVLTYYGFVQNEKHEEEGPENKTFFSLHLDREDEWQNLIEDSEY